MNVQLHVGNLTYDATEEELLRLFVPHGNIADIQIPRDPGTGRPRGFAFITMASAEGAQSAIELLNGRDLHGRTLAVSPAQQVEERTSFGGSRGSRRRHSSR